MNQIMSGHIHPTTNPVKRILWIGLLAGTLDIVTAVIVYKANPIQLCQFIASGAVGRDLAFSGGLGMAMLGLLIHYIIAIVWTAIFFLLYPKIRAWLKNKYVVGFLYGVVVWLVMNLVVLPLSQIPRGPFNLTQALIGMAILIAMVGLPISILTHRYYFPKREQG